MQKLKKIRTGPVQKKLFRPAGKESSTGPDRTGPDRPVTGTGYSSAPLLLSIIFSRHDLELTKL